MNKKLKAINEEVAKVALEKLQLESSKLKAHEDETHNQTLEPIADSSNNKSPAIAENENSFFYYCSAGIYCCDQ